MTHIESRIHLRGRASTVGTRVYIFCACVRSTNSFVPNCSSPHFPLFSFLRCSFLFLPSLSTTFRTIRRTGNGVGCWTFGNLALSVASTISTEFAETPDWPDRWQTWRFLARYFFSSDRLEHVDFYTTATGIGLRYRENWYPSLLFYNFANIRLTICLSKRRAGISALMFRYRYCADNAYSVQLVRVSRNLKHVAIQLISVILIRLPERA